MKSVTLTSGLGNVIERALTLAGSGQCTSMLDVKNRLQREGFEQIDAYLSGYSIRKDINRRLLAARSAS